MNTIYNLGIDIGNSYIKAKNLKMKAKIKTNYDPLDEEQKTKVVYKSNTYSIGVGTELTNFNKYGNEFYNVLVLTAIAKCLPEENYINCNLVIGVPIQYYKMDGTKETIKECLEKLKQQNIIVDGVNKTINIEKAEVFVEGAINVLYGEEYKDKNILVVDIGGYTIDVLEFNNNKIGKNSSIMKGGIMKLNREVLSQFNLDNKINITADDELVQKIANDEKYTINKNEVSLAKYKNDINIYLNELFNTLNLDYSLEDKKIIFIGGGAITLSSAIKQFGTLYDIQIIKDEYINAKVFQYLADKIFVDNKGDKNE